MEAHTIQADSQTAGSMPEKKFRAGAISVSVWQNAGTSKTGEPTSYRTISLQRGYKDKNGEWKNTTSLRVNDLPKAALLMKKAYEHIVLSPGDEE